MLNVRLAGDHLFGKLLFTWLSLMVSMVMSFCAVLFPTRCLGWDLELNWVSFWGVSFCQQSFFHSAGFLMRYLTFFGSFYSNSSVTRCLQFCYLGHLYAEPLEWTHLWLPQNISPVNMTDGNHLLKDPCLLHCRKTYCHKKSRPFSLLIIFPKA